MSTIKISEWMALHPYKSPGSTDYAYLKIANKLSDSWRSALMKNDIEEDIKPIVTITVAAYFEDVVSYTGLWQAFTRKHKEMYGKYLPFHDTSGDNYYDDEINLPDVAYLIWSVMQKEVGGAFVNPENPGIMDLAERMYAILDEEFEKAPINDLFLNYIQNERHYTDFYRLKEMFNWLYYDSYLMGTENTFQLELELDEAEDVSLSLHQFEYALRSDAVFNKKTGPLALPLKEWYANMLHGMGMEKEIALINAMESHSSDNFRVERVDKEYIYMTDTQEKEFVVLRSSFETLSKGALESEMLITSLVKFNGEWHTNGLSIWLDDEEIYWDLVNIKKDQVSTRKEVYENFLKTNEGHPIAYFRKLSEFQEWFKKVVDVPENVDMNERMFGHEENLVVFASPETDIAIIPNSAFYIKDPRNPFYDQKEAEEKGISLLVDYYWCPSEMLRYLRKNNMIPDISINSLMGKERGRELVHDNMDFIARFFRWNKY